MFGFWQGARMWRVGLVESGTADRALQHGDLGSARGDLGVWGVAGLKDPADAGRDQACERGKQVDKPVDDTDLDRDPKSADS